MKNLKDALLKIFNSRIFILFFLILIYFSVEQYIPLIGREILYSISVTIKDLLKLLMPFVIMVFISSTISSFQKKAPFFVIFIILFEAISNITSVYYAYISAFLLKGFSTNMSLNSLGDNLRVLWSLGDMPSWWNVSNGAICGVIVGIMQGLFYNKFLGLRLNFFKEKIEFIFSKIFSRIILFFIIGLIANISYNNMLLSLKEKYAFLLFSLLLVLIIYLMFLVLIGSGFVFKKWKAHLKNLLPAGFIAFTSCCSISTMPWTIANTSKNLDNKDFAKAMIPATTNVQQIGDCIANCFLCALIYNHFYLQFPPIDIWVVFSFVFVMARYATAAVTGGAIFLMLPIYQHYLSFTDEMIALILALNVILDPLITCCNVIANGALCRVFEMAYRKISTTPLPHQ